MRYIDLIIIHCSASDNPGQDNIEAIRDLHISPKSKKIQWGKYETHGKQWVDVGYHWFIRKDGTIEKGRPVSIPGAHVKGHNQESIGICFSGENGIPTNAQKKAWVKLREEIFTSYKLNESNVFPHNHFNKNKTCPNFELEELTL